jgi:hypothetical protein
MYLSTFTCLFIQLIFITSLLCARNWDTEGTEVNNNILLTEQETKKLIFQEWQTMKKGKMGQRMQQDVI